MITIPAAVGTTLRQFDEDGDYRDTPIIAWTYVTGNMVHPLFPVGGRSVGPESIIIHPANELVAVMYSHPETQFVTSDHEEVKERVADAIARHKEKGGETPAIKPTETPAAATEDRGPIKFGATKYKTQSFWYWPARNAVFTIEGEQVCPADPRVKKIKRDEFAQLKRDGATKISPYDGEIKEDDPAGEAGEDDAPDLTSFV